jgi:hypothetical protein
MTLQFLDESSSMEYFLQWSHLKAFKMFMTTLNLCINIIYKLYRNVLLTFWLGIFAIDEQTLSKLEEIVQFERSNKLYNFFYIVMRISFEVLRSNFFTNDTLVPMSKEI